MSTLTADDVRRMTHRGLFALFKTLGSPTLEEMNGEYAARMLEQPSPAATLTGYLSLYYPFFPGIWQCKAFRQVDDARGRGYNTFKHFGRIVQRYPMTTLVAPSRFDGRPAFQLVYRAFKTFFGDVHMVDEVRRIAPGAYLGIGTVGFTRAQRMIPLPFLLEGPDRAYRGDIGTERAGFDVRKEIPALA